MFHIPYFLLDGLSTVLYSSVGVLYTFVHIPKTMLFMDILYHFRACHRAYAFFFHWR